MKTIAIFCVLASSLIGCAGEKINTNFKSIEGRFGYGQHSKKIYPMHNAVWTDLQYLDISGKRTVVWPHLLIIWGNNIAITNDIAVLVGGKSELYDDGIERLRERLMAFEGPAGPPLDITDQVLQKYSLESGVKLTNIIKDSFVSLVKTNSGIQILFGVIKVGERGPGTINAHDAAMIISWHDIEAIMADVKKTGKMKKEKRSGVEYLKKD